MISATSGSVSMRDFSRSLGAMLVGVRVEADCEELTSCWAWERPLLRAGSEPMIISCLAIPGLLDMRL